MSWRVLCPRRNSGPSSTARPTLVTVSVSVRSASKPVAGLKASDFELKDNGVLQSIESFSVETLPIDVTLLLDLSRSVEGPRLDRLKYSVGETALLLPSRRSFQADRRAARAASGVSVSARRIEAERRQPDGVWRHIALRRAGGGDDARRRARSAPAHRRLHGRPGHDQHSCRSRPCATSRASRTRSSRSSCRRCRGTQVQRHGNGAGRARS